MECICVMKKERKRIPIKLTTKAGKKIEISNEEEANRIIEDIKKGKFIVDGIKKGTKKKNPLPPSVPSLALSRPLW